MAAVLQTGVNLGIMLASLAVFVLAAANQPPRTVFLVGALPALLVLWIRRAVPEPEEWEAAKQQTTPPPFADLFRGSIRRITVLTLVVCALALTAHWAFNFWYLQYVRNLPEIAERDDAYKTMLVTGVGFFVVGVSIVGNFLAAWLARWLGYRRAIAFLCLAYFLSMFVTYYVPRDLDHLWYGLAAIGLCQGVFALFTMYLPPLFPTLLRTSGAGFCYNFGRVAAGLGTVFFGLFAKVGDYRLSLLYASFLFIPTAAVAWLLPELAHELPRTQESAGEPGASATGG
jgi:MFS family permease